MPNSVAHMNVPVSVLIPVKNEVNNLGRCLNAIAGWASEVVVVDSQSTDGTIELADRHTATVLQFRYQGGWPKKRQWALESYKWHNDWILLLDADEILTDEVKQEINSAIRNPATNGYWLNFPIVFLGRLLRHGDTELKKLSLFRRGKGRYEKRLENQDASMSDMEIHEHVVVHGPTGCIRHPVRHENFNSLERYIEKHNAYSNWEAHVLLHGDDSEMQPSLFGNQAQRRRWLKKKFIRVPGSPLLRFLYVYLLRGGFLDGRAGFTYAMFKFVQTCHVKAKMYEMRVRSRERESTFVTKPDHAHYKAA